MKLLTRCMFTLLLVYGLSITTATAGMYVPAGDPDAYDSGSYYNPVDYRTDYSAIQYYRDTPDAYGYYYLHNPPVQYVYPWYYIGAYYER